MEKEKFFDAVRQGDIKSVCTWLASHSLRDKYRYESDFEDERGVTYGQDAISTSLATKDVAMLELLVSHEGVLPLAHDFENEQKAISARSRDFHTIDDYILNHPTIIPFLDDKSVEQFIKSHLDAFQIHHGLLDKAMCGAVQPEFRDIGLLNELFKRGACSSFSALKRAVSFYELEATEILIDHSHGFYDSYLPECLDEALENCFYSHYRNNCDYNLNTSNRIPICELLIKHGANVNTRNGALLNIAARIQDNDDLNYLLSKGADPNLYYRELRETPTVYICVENNNFEGIKALIEHGLNTADSDYRVAVLHAAGERNFHLTEFLFNHSTDRQSLINTIDSTSPYGSYFQKVLDTEKLMAKLESEMVAKEPKAKVRKL